MRLAVVFFIFLFNLSANEIHVIFTSAIIDKQHDLRRIEYRNSFYKLRSYGLNPWVIEASNIQNSFYDTWTSQVLYPNQNNPLLRNKGVNELMSLRVCLDQLPFQDEDIVIKITGRYFLFDDFFINQISATASFYDVWGIFGKHFVGEGHLVTGCFAMRWKFFKQIIREIDLLEAEEKYIPIEQLIAESIEKKALRVNKMANLHLWARVFFDGENASIMEF